MKDTATAALGAVGVIAIIVALSFLSFGMYSYFYPRQIAVQYKAYKESATYNQGMAGTLEKQREEYATVNASGKAAICGVVNEEMSDYNTFNLSPANQAFVNECR